MEGCYFPIENDDPVGEGEESAATDLDVAAAAHQLQVSLCNRGGGLCNNTVRSASNKELHMEAQAHHPSEQRGDAFQQGGSLRASGEIPSGEKLDLCEAEAIGDNRPCTCHQGAEQVPQFHLRVSDGKYIHSIFRVPSLSEYPGIGRSRHNAICLLADDQVSRFHAYLESTPEGWVVLKNGSRKTGLGSSNGTFVNSNCTRIGPEGYQLYVGDVIAVGATELVVQAGVVPETACTSPPLQVPMPAGVWLRAESENPWKKQMEKGAGSVSVGGRLSVARQLAFLMGTHSRLGRASPVSAIDHDLVALILRHCSFTIHRAHPPPLPARDKQGQQEITLDLASPCFPGGRTAEEFLNASSEPFPGRCGGVGDRPCVGFRVTKVVRVLNSSLWRPYHWRKQCIAEGLPEMQQLDSSRHLAAHPMGTGPALDPAANEFLAFHGQSSFAIYGMKDAGICQEIEDPVNMFGGGVYLSCSAFRANLSIPCSSCGGGHLGARAECQCVCDAGMEHLMMVARVTLGDAHICKEYDAEAYRGPADRPRRRPPVNASTGFVHNSIVGESIANGGSHLRYRELVVYDRFQCYPEYIIHFKRVPGPPLGAAGGGGGGRRGRNSSHCHLPL